MGDRDWRGRFTKGNQAARNNRGGRRSKADEFAELCWMNDFDEPEPQTEAEVRERFRILNEAVGLFDVVLSQEPFPDFVLRATNGKLIRAEAERKSSHFKQHGHDEQGCDLIICWLHDWRECPLPVFPIAHLWFAFRQFNRMGVVFGLQELRDIGDRL